MPAIMPEPHRGYKGLNESLFKPLSKRKIGQSLKEPIESAVSAHKPGFKNGWVSSNAVSELLGGFVHGPTLVKVLRSLGYNFVSRVNTPDGRVRLYHVHSCEGMSGRQILAKYNADQEC